MTWTWDATDLSTDLARVRMAVGDVNSVEQLLSDEQIAAILADYPDWREASAEACAAIRAKLARTVDRSNQGISATRSQAMQHYLDLETTLRSKLTRSCVPVHTGAASIDDKDNVNADSDKVASAFGREDFSR